MASNLPGEHDTAAYVDAACALHGLALEPDEHERVVAQFRRLADIAAPVLALELPDDAEMVPTSPP